MPHEDPQAHSPLHGYPSGQRERPSTEPNPQLRWNPYVDDPYDPDPYGPR